jgi:hypothetical protein
MAAPALQRESRDTTQASDSARRDRSSAKVTL